MDDQHAADAIAASVRRIFSEVLGREHLPPNASLDAIGLDSMAMIEVSVRIEETWRIEMPDLDELARLQIGTLDELVELVRKRVQQ
jgi:acyl carrier protein